MRFVSLTQPSQGLNGLCMKDLDVSSKGYKTHKFVMLLTVNKIVLSNNKILKHNLKTSILFLCLLPSSCRTKPLSLKKFRLSSCIN